MSGSALVVSRPATIQGAEQRRSAARRPPPRRGADRGAGVYSFAVASPPPCSPSRASTDKSFAVARIAEPASASLAGAEIIWSRWLPYCRCERCSPASRHITCPRRGRHPSLRAWPGADYFGRVAGGDRREHDHPDYLALHHRHPRGAGDHRRAGQSRLPVRASRWSP